MEVLGIGHEGGKFKPSAALKKKAAGVKAREWLFARLMRTGGNEWPAEKRQRKQRFCV